MLAMIWRFFVALFDWRTNLRKLFGRPVVDVVFISNMRDDVDRRRYLGGWHPPEGHFDGTRYWLKGVSGRIHFINVTAKEMLTIDGHRKAQGQFIAAVNWAKQNGARVILLAAGTKRLFKEDGLRELKVKFPGMIFTIGDNGTALLLIQEVLRALEGAKLKPCCSKVAILGSYGFLGEVVTRVLRGLGYEVVGIGSNTLRLNGMAEKYGIAVCQTFAQAGKVDAVVACTHSQDVRLTAKNIELLRRDNKKLLVVDVAEPSNFSQGEYEKCSNVIIRQDAGNAYSSKLKYVLGVISYRMLRLTRGVTFGCFAEAISLASALKRGRNVGGDWLTVSRENMENIAEMFDKDTFIVPFPYCFGQQVKSFDLSFGFDSASVGKSSQVIRSSTAWKLAMQRLNFFL